MDLPQTKRGNKHVLVIQDFLTKWPWVFPIPDQKTSRIVEIFVQEIIPMCGVPECLLSDRGTNLLPYLMKDVCSLLGIKKLNTTAYHPQCNGLTERFNRTLKMMLRKQVDVHGKQWDQYLHEVLRAYRNTPHEATSEKPSFLLFGYDCGYPIEAAFLPAEQAQVIELTSYRQELAVTLTEASDLATQSVQAAQKKYKRQCDRLHKCTPVPHQVGDLVLIRFPQEESGKMKKLSRPWHGPYRVVQVTSTGVVAQRVYNSKGDQICIHRHQVTRCPPNFPAGYCWYGDRRYGPGWPPKGIKRLMPAHDTPLPESAKGTENQPEVDSDRASELESEVNPSAETVEGTEDRPELDFGRASELECQVNLSTDRPFVTPKHLQQLHRVRTRTRTIKVPNYFSY